MDGQRDEKLAWTKGGQESDRRGRKKTERERQRRRKEKSETEES